MLGGDGPRTYFVAFTTPAEARGLGGFMGTWAELRADDGRLEVDPNGSDRRADRRRMGAAPPVLDGPADYLARYGRFGAGVDGEPVAVDFWSNVTMSPDFPSITEVFAQLYPASGGTRDRRRHRRRRRVDRPLPRAHRSDRRSKDRTGRSG